MHGACLSLSLGSGTTVPSGRAECTRKAHIGGLKDLLTPPHARVRECICPRGHLCSIYPLWASVTSLLQLALVCSQGWGLCEESRVPPLSAAWTLPGNSSAACLCSGAEASVGSQHHRP